MELNHREAEEEGSVAVEDDVFDDEDVGVAEEPSKSKSHTQQTTRGSSPPLHLTVASNCSSRCGRWFSSGSSGFGCCKHPLLWSAPGKGAFLAYALVFAAILATLLLIPDPNPTHTPVWVATLFIFPSCQFLWWAFGIHLFRFLLSTQRYGLDGVDVDQTPIRVSRVDPSIAIFPTDVLCAGAHHPGLGQTKCWWWCVVASVVGFGLVCAGVTYQLLVVSCVLPRPYTCLWLLPQLGVGTLLAVLGHKESCKHNEPFVEGIREDQFLRCVAAPADTEGGTSVETQWWQELGIERGEAFQVVYNDHENDHEESDHGGDGTCHPNNTSSDEAGTVVRYISLKGVTRNNTNLTETNDV